MKIDEQHQLKMHPKTQKIWNEMLVMIPFLKDILYILSQRDNCNFIINLWDKHPKLQSRFNAQKPNGVLRTILMTEFPINMIQSEGVLEKNDTFIVVTRSFICPRFYHFLFEEPTYEKCRSTCLESLAHEHSSGFEISLKEKYKSRIQFLIWIWQKRNLAYIYCVFNFWV